MINNRLLTEAHGVIGTLSNGKDVGRHLIPSLGAVHANSPHGVNGEPLVGVDGNTEEAGVGVDQSLHVSHLQIEQHGGVIEVSQVGHVLAAVKLGRVHLPNLILLEHLLITTLDCDGNLVSLGGLDKTLEKASGWLVGHPA